MIGPLVALLLQAQTPEIVSRARADCGRGVDFHALVVPETVYVGQQATYQLGVFIDQDTRSRLRRNPEFLPPESRSMLSYDLPDRGGVYNTTVGGQPCEAHVFRRALFALTPGRYAIPSARLSYSIPQSPSFFSREENYTLRSEGVTLTAIDPPAAGRPADWTGAVGAWRVSARVDTARTRAGDPLVVTLRIEGQGNVTLLPRPVIDVPWATVVAADERVRLDSTPSALRGNKEFDWLVTPRAAGAQRLPAIRFVYFDPWARRYEIALTQPITVRVAAGDVVVADSASSLAEPVVTPTAVLRSDLGDDAPLPLGDSIWVWVLLTLAPVVSLGAWLVRRPRRAPRVATPAERLRALFDRSGRGSLGKAQGSNVGDPGVAAEVRRALLDGLRVRTGLTAAALAEPGAWHHALTLEGVSDASARGVEQFIHELDACAFGVGTNALGDAPQRALALLLLVHSEARTRQRLTPHIGLRRVTTTLAIAGAAVLAAPAVMAARDPQLARAAFAAGATAWAGADYLRAARLFEDAAREAPRSSAAWANAGFSAWATHDTASAVVGWQRALRLDPTAPDLRSHLALVRAPEDIGLARVLRVPARLPSLVALMLWLGSWSLVARQCWRRRRAWPLAVIALFVAGTAVVTARINENRLEGRGLVVIVEPTGLRAVPALGAQGGVVPIVGEVARVMARQGVWLRVALDGDRSGWIASERTQPLGRD